MKVLDLRCPAEHRFEGWFASEADYQAQSERKLVTCPMCNSADVVRLPSAPRLGRGRGAEAAAPESANAPAAPSGDPTPVEVQARWLQAMRKLVAESEDVGDRFAQEARRIHQGEADPRSIRGHASSDEVASLREDGIPVLQVALPESVKGPVH